MTNFNFETLGSEVVEVFRERIQDRIAPLVVAITGPSPGGIGSETVLSIAKGNPRCLILISRDLSKIQSVADNIREISSSTDVLLFQCDLASQSSIRQVVPSVLAAVPHIDILINNAATPAQPYKKTEDGIETQFATNYIGHFLLTNLLIYKILAARPNARVVNVSSSSMRHRTHARFDDYNFSDDASYSEWDGYIQSKLALVLFTKALSHRLVPHQKQSFSLHPGSIQSGMQAQVSSDAMARALKRRQDDAASHGQQLQRAKRKTVQQGCATTLVAAFDPDITERSGDYLEDGKVSEGSVPSFATLESAQKLWALSEELLGQKFEWV